MKKAILSVVQAPPARADDTVVLAAAALAEAGVSAFLRRHFLRYRAVELRIANLRMGVPLKPLLAARCLTFGTVRAVDTDGRALRLGPVGVLDGLVRGVAARLAAPGLLRRASRQMAAFKAGHAARPARPRKANRVLYLRCDLWFGLEAGGSVAHTAGVLNAFHATGLYPDFWTPSPVPLVRPEIVPRPLLPDQRWWPRPLHHELAFNRAVGAQLSRAVGAPAVYRFVYHRNAPNCYAAALVARDMGLALVLEYNGSEAWARQHWGGEPAPAVTRQIELFNLRAADLVVVVSEPLRREVRAQGVPEDRIVLAPNGVDPQRYRPDIDGSPVRRHYGLERKLVFGFIGTFGRWHGADILARAFCALLARRPDLARHLHLLMVGDGAMAGTVREIVAAARAEPQVTLTGLVPQSDGPVHLAAADILVSPHVPNPDGTAFFGSPTKLFEYMAMGKPILASDLDQIGEVLAHERTARLVPPADIDRLAGELERAADDPAALAPLGRAARQEAVANHSWTRHVERIVAAADRLGL